MFHVLAQVGPMLMQQATLWDKQNRWHRVISDVLYHKATRVPHYMVPHLNVCMRLCKALMRDRFDPLWATSQSDENFFSQDRRPAAENVLACFGILQRAPNSMMISLDDCREQYLNLIICDCHWSLQWDGRRSCGPLCAFAVTDCYGEPWGTHKNDWMPFVFDILLHLPFVLICRCFVTLHWIVLPRIAAGKCSEALFWTACPERKRWLRNSDTWWKWPVTESVYRTADCGVMLVCWHHYTQEVHYVSTKYPTTTYDTLKSKEWTWLGSHVARFCV